MSQKSDGQEKQERNQGILSISRGVLCTNFRISQRSNSMELIEVILSKENLNRAYKKVTANKGASGVDGVTVEELGSYIRENKGWI